MNCKECNQNFTCGCQKTTASDGSVVHKTCLTDYERKISSTRLKSNP